ncbi:MAG: type IV pilus secretin PilQ [bacterium]
MKSMLIKLPLALLVLAVLAAGCAGPGGQMRASVEEAAVARVLSVTGEDLPDRVRVTIEGTAPLAYTIFRLSEPARLIVDLADTDVSGLAEQMDISLGSVSTVQTIQYDEDAGRIGRLEIALVELWDYETSRLENNVVVDFLKPVTATKEEAPAEAAQKAPDVEVVELTIEEPVITAEAAQPAPMPEEPLGPATTISDVVFSETSDGMDVEFIGDGAIGRYDALNLKGPARLVIDIWGVTKGFKPRVIPVDTYNVDRIRVGEHRKEGKLRFVLDFDRDDVPPYGIEEVGDRLILSLGVERVAEIEVAEVAPQPEPEPQKVVEEVTAPAPVPEVEPVTAPAPEVAPFAAAGVSDIRYRADGDDGTVMVISDDPVTYSISQPDPKHLLVDLADVTLPAGLVRSMDTRNEGGPLQALSSFNPKGGEGARVSLTLAPGTLFDIDQSGGTLSIVLTTPEAPQPVVQAPEVAEVTVLTAPAAPEVPEQVVVAPPSPPPVKQPPKVRTEVEEISPADQGPMYTGELITLDFQDAELKNVIRLIAEVSGLNIITSDDVGGRISMRMVNVPWDQALDVILKTKGLGQVRELNVVRIAPMQKLESERTAARKAKEAQMKAEDLQLKIVPLSYSKADEVVGQLTGFLSSRGTINTDRRTNSLIVKDLEENIDRIVRLVEKLDIPTPQVRIEARIVIVDESYSKTLGIKWGGAYNDGSTVIFGNTAGSDSTLGGGNFLVNLPASSPTAILGFSFGGINNFDNLDLRLSAMEQANKGRIISSPTLMVIQNETASIEVNNPFPENRTSTEVGEGGTTTTTEVSFPNIWTKLRITPQVTSNEDIFMEVAVEKDSKGQQAIFDQNTFTGVNTHKLETKIVLNNHGTAVIGGVYTENRKDGGSAVPFFSKIPILGWLFKNKTVDNTREELLIFINASIVEG